MHNRADTGRALARGARRRGARRGELAERAILETAERLLAERPLSAIAVEELARGAGISRPSFYFYFESREAVLRALAAGLSEELYRAGEPWLRPGGRPPARAAQAALEQNLRLWRLHGPVLRAIVRARETDGELAALWKRFSRRCVGAVADHIERERVAGAAPPAPPDARHLAGMLLNMSDRTWYDVSQTGRSATRDRAAVDTMTTVWMRAIYRDDEPGGRRWT